MSITADMIRGHTDTIILRQLIEKDSYGYEINKAVQEKTGNQYELKEATLYTAFRRLEQAGLLESHIAVSGDCTACLPEKYWSHRVTHGERGSQAAMIELL